MNQKHKSVKRVLIWTLFLNWAVALAKIIYGYLINCVSIQADGFHSLSDGASNIIGLIGINLASKPQDKEHPYGHKKYETVAAMAISGILFIVAGSILKSAFARLFNPILPEIGLVSFVLMIFTVCVNLVVMSYEYRKGKELESDFLIADSMHTKSDIFVSLTVLGALAAIKFGIPILDAIIPIALSIFIIHSAIEILRSGSQVLCDTAPIDTKKIAARVLTIEGVRSCHKIRTRGRRDDIYVDLHVQVKPDMHVDKAHELSYEIEDLIKSGFKGVTDVVVHIEPRRHSRKK